MTPDQILSNLRQRRADKSFQQGDSEPCVSMLLYSLVSAMQPGPVLEIGTFLGFTTCHLALACKETGGGPVVTVDPWRQQAALDLAAELGLDGIYFVHGTSREHLPTFLPLFRFAFVDGDHTFDSALRDMQMTWRLLVPGGLMVVHDTLDRPHAPEVGEAMETFAEEEGQGHITFPPRPMPEWGITGVTIFQKREK